LELSLEGALGDIPARSGTTRRPNAFEGYDPQLDVTSNYLRTIKIRLSRSLAYLLFHLRKDGFSLRRRIIPDQKIAIRASA
jgi:hypothetical protein